MYTPKLEKDVHCPLEYGLDMFGKKWNARIICVLSDKKVLRYNELRDEMTNITDAVLSASLKKLITNGIIIRQSYDEIPPRVEYSLSKRGEDVVPILQDICRWSGKICGKPRPIPTIARCRQCDYSPENKANGEISADT